MLLWIRTPSRGRSRGFTLIEIVVALSILSILIALAVPHYMSARKRAYKAEADTLLQEAKSMEWAYYQQYNLFDTSGTSIGLALPSTLHWADPAFGGTTDQSVQVLVSGCSLGCTPLENSDQISIILYSDGSSTGGSTF